ncbi:hypothetical protein IL332_06895 [Aeromonas caviae]|uniref:hypothetical protein n=1 Tax=Aeromonas caviae TaxID=648 RepID=UPI000A9A007A|nr:hypothetical protein [Aeromonas caviae]QOK20516.1 hypothetical protein IL332_06895 [Aeromonas caviae]
MRHYVIASFLIILGLISIAYKANLAENAWQIPYLSDFSSALLVGGLLSLLFKIVQEKESESTLRRLLRIHDSVDELGLKEIMPEVQAYNFTNIIQDSESLVVVMNDGLRWVGNNTVALQNRFSKKSTTEIFTVDPNSTFVATLAAKTSMSEADLKKKIHDTWARIEDAYNKSTKKGELKIYSLKTYPTKSIFLTEDELVETPYQTASGRASIPVFIYQKVARHDSPYHFAKNDISAMRAESKIEKDIKPT